MKNILLFSTGLSPQVVTESLHYHTQIKNRAIDSIHIITDKLGRELVLEKLLNKKTGWYYKLLKEYAIPDEIDFTKKNVYGLKKIDGTPIVDLKTVDDNNAAVNQISTYIKDHNSLDDIFSLFSKNSNIPIRKDINVFNLMNNLYLIHK